MKNKYKVTAVVTNSTIDYNPYNFQIDPAHAVGSEINFILELGLPPAAGDNFKICGKYWDYSDEEGSDYATYETSFKIKNVEPA